MKTAEERVQEWWDGGAWKGSVEGGVTGSVVRLLKEQDKITRHACAEAVTTLASWHRDDCISRTYAFNAIMNARAT